jgi:putative transposase
MILTYKINHSFDLSKELEQARKIAEFCIINRVQSSSKVKQFGLKSILSNQILRKYGRNKGCKKISNVNLIVPAQGISFKNGVISIPSLKLYFPVKFERIFAKVNQIEISETTIFVSVTVPELEPKTTEDFIGVDLNSTGHLAVAANPRTGKVLKLGKKAWHIRKKYSNIRKKLQKRKKFRKIKSIGNRESRIIRDLNHKISRKIVDWANENNCGIRLENLKGVRKNKSKKKALSYSVNSWSFYQLRQMIEYKTKLLGVQVQYIAPYYTSQICSKSGLMGERNGEIFKSPVHGVESSHVNAAFNIAKAINGFSIENGVSMGDSVERRKRYVQGAADTPESATFVSAKSGESSGNATLKTTTLEPHML